jgi:hypothetical protein
MGGLGPGPLAPPNSGPSVTHQAKYRTDELPTTTEIDI